MKKYLSLLLLVPFLLVGCNTNDSGDGEKTAGSYGDPVVTQEEIDSFTMYTSDKYESKQNKVGTITVPKDAKNKQSSNRYQMVSYTIEKDEVNKLEVVSVIKAGSIFSVPDLSIYESWSVNYNTIGNPTIDAAEITLVTKDEETDEEIYHYTIIDAIGTKMIEIDSKEELDFTVSSLAKRESEYISGNNRILTNYAIASYFDEKTGKNIESYFKYDDGFTTAVKVTEIYDKTSLVDNNKFVFTVGEGEKAVEYSGKHQEYNNNQIFKITHTEEGQEVVKTIIVPTNDYGIFNHHVIYQENVETDDHDLDYTYALNDEFYYLKTHLIDLATGEDKMYDIPFVIDSYMQLPAEQKIGEAGVLNKYGIVEGKKIENKQQIQGYYIYVIDSDLVFHDLINRMTTSHFLKVGNGYYNSFTKELLDENKNVLGTVKDTVVKVYDKGILISRGNKLGIIDEKGKYVVKPDMYSNKTDITNDIIYFAGNTPMIFDMATLTDITPKWNENKIYNKIQLSKGYYVEGDKKAEEGSKNKVYYLGNVIETVDYDIDISVVEIFTLDLGGMEGEASFELVNYEAKEGDDVYVVYRKDIVRTAFGHYGN